MFTTLANYLLGTRQPEASETESVDAGIRLRAVDADDDWVLVDNSESDDDRGVCGLEESVFETIPSLELPVSMVPHSLPILRPTPTEYYSLSRTSSTGSLPCLSFEESWYLTPPPCFTSEGPIHVETSPLENLLIEHPSMSVYQHSNPHPHPAPRPRSSSTGGSSHGSESSSEEELPADEVRQPPRPRGNRILTPSQQEKQCIQIRSAQKIRQRRANQVLKRNNMERNNKAREINSSRNKRQRRSDHQQHHSGANNNRKCC